MNRRQRRQIEAGQATMFDVIDAPVDDADLVEFDAGPLLAALTVAFDQHEMPVDLVVETVAPAVHDPRGDYYLHDGNREYWRAYSDYARWYFDKDRKKATK